MPVPIREQDRSTYVLPSTIECLEADRAFSLIFFTNKSKKTVSGSLSEYCQLLTACGLFCRVHRSYAVNIYEIAWYDNHHFLILKSGKSIPISEEGKIALASVGFIL